MLTAEQVAEYLRQNPGFFENHVDILMGLQVPHPRFRDRLFVLAPLAEIAPGLRDPVTGLTMRELLNALNSQKPTPNSAR